MNMRLRKFWELLPELFKKKKKKAQNSSSWFRVGNLTKYLRGTTIKLCSILSFTTTVANYNSTTVELHWSIVVLNQVLSVIPLSGYLIHLFSSCSLAQQGDMVHTK